MVTSIDRRVPLDRYAVVRSPLSLCDTTISSDPSIFALTRAFPALPEPRSEVEPFAKGRSSAGFGLGLAIARRAVAVHGGSIRAERAASAGVEVQIELPLDV